MPVLAEITENLRDQISSATSEREKRQTRWNQCRDMFFSDFETGNGATQGGYTGSISIPSIKGDRTVISIMASIFSVTPYITLTGMDGSECPARQIALQKVLEASNLQTEEYPVANNSYWSNMGIAFIEPRTDPTYRIKFTVVDPNDFIAYPTFETELEECELLLRAVTRTRGQIQAMIDAGTYFDVEIEGTAPSSNIRVSASEEAGVDSREAIVIYEGVAREPGKPWYDCTVSKSGLTIYAWSKRKFKYAPFVVHTIKAPRGTDGIYASVSKSNDLQQVQIDFDTTRKHVYDAMEGQANPSPVFDSRDAAELYQKNRAQGQAMYNPGGHSMGTFGPTLDVPGASSTTALTLDLGDQISNISQMAMGATQEGVNTATEAEIINQGAQAGLNSYILLFGLGLERIGMIVDDMLQKDKTKQWQQDYFASNPQFVAMYQDDVKKAVMIKAAVTNTKSTPMAQLSALNSYVQVAAKIPPMAQKVNWDNVNAKYIHLLAQNGFPDAESLIAPPDPQQAIGTLAQATQLPPQVIIQALLLAKQQAQSMGGQPGNLGPMQPPQAPPTGQLPVAPVNPMQQSTMGSQGPTQGV